jgi:DAK2 domain fusion protein YloV
MTAEVESHSGEELRQMFAAATSWLERNADAINSINVFPVPDGDTGTNMYLTMRATLDEAYQSDSDAADAVAKAMARGALMGARGNSGVILSQIFRGMAEGLAGKARFSGHDFVSALQEASHSAYKAVSQPVEGTILTVMREVAAGAKSRALSLSSNLRSVLASAVESAREAVARTPSLLPVLRDAGVVDAGGQGLYVMLEGALRYLRGDTTPALPITALDPETTWLKETASIHDRGESPYGYCTEFLISGSDMKRDTIVDRMQALGDSVIVAGDETLLRVHIHTMDPGAALSFGTSVGNLIRVKVDNIQSQAEDFVARARPEGPAEAVAIGTVVVASGAGLHEALRSVGASAIVPGGQTMNPSTEEILAAIKICPSEQVIVLPNNKNVVMSARQAAEHSDKNVRVVPTISIPQAVAALLALNQEATIEENVAAMEEARGSVRSAEITRAVRPALINNLRIRRNQAIAVVDGELSVAARSLAGAVRKSVERMLSEDSSLITLYYGEDVTREEAQALAGHLREEHPSLEVETVPGGQPHYPYIVSVE